MSHDRYSERDLRSILRSVRTLAMIGASDHWNRPSHFVMKYLQAKGFRVIPVNPRIAKAGGRILSEPAYASLADIPEPFDMVDMFRGRDAAPSVVEEMLPLSPRPKVLWMQLGIRHDEAAARAEDAGITVVMNRCPKIEYARLFGELGWGGLRTGVISSRRRAR